MSGYLESPVITEMVQKHGVLFVPKPINAGKIIEILETTLAVHD